MKKLLILILTLALSSTLLLSACAPDESETLYGKPKLSQLSDDEIIKLMSQLKLSREYDKEFLPTIKQIVVELEEDAEHLFVYGNPIDNDIGLLFIYYYDYDMVGGFDISQYIK